MTMVIVRPNALGITLEDIERVRAEFDAQDIKVEFGRIENFRIIESSMSEMEPTKKPSKPYYRKNQRW